MARNIPHKRLTVRLSEAEYTHLKKQTEASGLKIEPFLRSLIIGAEIKPRPPEQYSALLRELSAIGNNLNQIAFIANGTHETTPYQLDECRRLFTDMWRLVKDNM